MTIIIDEEPLNEIPLNNIIPAIKAEGLNVTKTYGPVYQHMLFNLAENEYRFGSEEGCPVADNCGYERAILLGHAYLGCEEAEVEKMGDILVKVAKNAKELK